MVLVNEKAEVTPEKFNEYHIRLMVKEEHIEKLTYQLRKVEDELNDLKIENTYLIKKHRGSFSTQQFNQYNETLKNFRSNSACISANDTERQKFILELETKDKEIAKLSEVICTLNEKTDSQQIQFRVFESEVQSKNY